METRTKVLKAKKKPAAVIFLIHCFCALIFTFQHTLWGGEKLLRTTTDGKQSHFKTCSANASKQMFPKTQKFRMRISDFCLSQQTLRFFFMNLIPKHEINYQTTVLLDNFNIFLT